MSDVKRTPSSLNFSILKSWEEYQMLLLLNKLLERNVNSAGS